MSELALQRIQKVKEKKFSRLDLSHCHIQEGNSKEIFQKIIELTWLESVNLFNNQIQDITLLQDLKRLKYLNLGNTQIQNTASLQKFTQLQILYLDNTQIQDIAALEDLTLLKKLIAFNNQIQNLEPLQNLAQLQFLYLDNNQIQDITPLQSLHQLQNLSITNNQIQDKNFLKRLIRLPNLENLYLFGNPIEGIPLELLGEDENYNSLEDLRNYFAQIKHRTVPLYEAKLIIVGEPGAGKTTLASKILDKNYLLQSDEKTTQGIEVRPWIFPFNKKEFRVNIWDFGGQEIYKATHKFFLTKSSLYILLADNREENTDFEYWLDLLRLLGANSPVLIVLNEKQDRKRQIPESRLKGAFENLKEVFSVNLATNRNLIKLLSAIKRYIKELEHIGAKLPETWSKVREILEADNRNYIHLDEYLQICEENEIEKEEYALQLSGYLHNIGVFLHFQEDMMLNNLVILKPQWGTDAAYKVLDDELAIQKKGRINVLDLPRIWKEKHYRGKHAELIQLMCKFELAYQLPDTQAYIIPQLLSLEPPQYHWNNINNLRLNFQYEFMPKGILVRFIVRLHRYIKEDAWVWGEGVILERNETQAEVIELSHKGQITIRIQGRNKKELMTLIVEEINQINQSYAKLPEVVDMRVPCACTECNQADEPYFYKYKDLLKSIEKGEGKIQCRNSFEMIDARTLIDDIFINKENIDLEQIYESLEMNDIPQTIQQLLKFNRANEHYPTTLAINTSFQEYEHDRITGKDVRGRKEDIVSRLSELLGRIEKTSMRMGRKIL